MNIAPTLLRRRTSRFTRKTVKFVGLVPDAGSSPLWSVAADGSGAHELFAAPSGLQSFAPSPDGGQVKAERGHLPGVLHELVRRGHQVSIVLRNGGGYQGILIDPKTNMLQGGAEYRTDGCAVGY